jgi:hypothetical protein
MLMEMKLGFDVVDPSADFASYRLLILPDDVPLDGALAKRLTDYVAAGGAILFSGSGAFDADGNVMLPAGIVRAGPPVEFDPSYLRAAPELDTALPASPFVMYGTAERISTIGAEVLADVMPSYFNRSYRHFSSHQHAPDDPSAETLGAGVTLHGSIAYVAYPIFRMYQAMGQPLYRYLVRGLIRRLLPDPVVTTDMTSSGRATLARQADRNRHILHLLYGPPQVRGKRVPVAGGGVRVMEMIEDIPPIGPISATVRLPKSPTRVYDALTGEDVAWTNGSGGVVSVTVPSLHIHKALVFEGTT